jgi:hypothetical protein
MPRNLQDEAALEMLNGRIRTLLPEQYQDRYEEVQPVSMGSAGLKYGRDGRVAWDEMWQSFCDLAMAGGPPHKGTLLLPASEKEVNAEPDQYRNVTQEICRGIELVTGLVAEPSPSAGWVRVSCVNRSTAEWLLRAITTENVAVRRVGVELELPAGPFYRIEKEIKNVITVLAKTCHYWFGHTSAAHRRTIRELMEEMEEESPLLQSAFPDTASGSLSIQSLKNKMAGTLVKSGGIRTSGHEYSGWLGVECRNVPSAVWLMRAMLAKNVLSRREGSVCFVPVDTVRDPEGEIAVASVLFLQRLRES